MLMHGLLHWLLVLLSAPYRLLPPLLPEEARPHPIRWVAVKQLLQGVVERLGGRGGKSKSGKS